MLGMPYTTAIDIWSLGCIAYELFTGYPMFPGRSEADQFNMFIEILGPPPPDMLVGATRKNHFYEDSGELKPLSHRKVGIPGKKDLQFPDKLLEKFVFACLTWKPEDRPLPN
jgi:serine/threonine protein kinase